MSDTRQEILEDIKQKFSAAETVALLDDGKKKEYIDGIRQALQPVDIESIYSTEGINQFKKLYLTCLKYDRDVLTASERKGAKFYFEGKSVFNLRGNSVLKVEVLRIDENILRVEGMIGAGITKLPFRLYVKDFDGNRFDATLGDYGKAVVTGLDGETFYEGEAFAVDVRIHDDSRIRFILEVENEEMVLKPVFSRATGIDKNEEQNYCVKNGYIVKLRNRELLFTRDTKVERFKSERGIKKSHKTDADKSWQEDRKVECEMIKAVYDQRLSNRVAFVSFRNDGDPRDNLGDAYAAVNKPKVSYCSRMIGKEQPYTLKAAECVYSSKVVVTDDGMSLFREFGKKKGQYFIQLWHAAGAFKKFGVDSTKRSRSVEAEYHRNYDLVSVSSEYVRDIYANAFCIDKERVKALGVPRTDCFYDSDHLDSRKSLVYDKMPELKGKQIILYAPSFRGKGDNRVYLPEVDYEKINDHLNEDQVLVLCPHPLTPEGETIGDYDRIKLVRDVSTADMMIAADLLITDYSSIIFDYSLLNKPMAFFCYDYDSYDRDFYLDYDTDLPGEIFKDEDSLTEYLGKGVFETDSRLDAFREKYMSACDGHSSEKVAAAIESFL